MAISRLESERRLRILNDPYREQGFTIRQVGIGDGIQFTSLPENYYKKTGYYLIDLSEPWYLDYNPFVQRKHPAKNVKELWNYPKFYEWPKIRNSVYLSNSEIHLSVFGLKNPHLIRPRLYRYEDYPFQKRHKILFQTHGKSHDALPDEVISHVIKKYKSEDLFHIGLPTDPDYGIPKIMTPHLWDLVKEISECRMLIGPDSGPAWIAACYPDVIIKKVRTKFQFGYESPEDWIPLDINNPHSFWDDRMFQIYNIFEEDCGFTQSYKKI